SSRCDMPFVRTLPQNVTHTITPFASGFTSLLSAHRSPQEVPSFALPVFLLAGTVGLETVFARNSRPLAQAGVAQRWLLGPSAQSHRLLLATATLGPPAFRVNASLSLDESTFRPAFVALGIGTKFDAIALESNLSHYAAGSPEPLMRLPRDLPEMALQRPVLAWAERAITVARQTAMVPIGAYVSLGAQVYETIWPRPRVDLVGYTLGLSPACGCFEVRLVGWHRLGSSVPELLATVSVPTL
ncbi:MAG: hypothetical protein MUC50_19510, partial [Myxococcota bacterium]|nr:hypothetical protein [Myxococcota bacterium]